MHKHHTYLLFINSLLSILLCFETPYTHPIPNKICAHTTTKNCHRLSVCNANEIKDPEYFSLVSHILFAASTIECLCPLFLCDKNEVQNDTIIDISSLYKNSPFIESIILIYPFASYVQLSPNLLHISI